MGKGERWFEIEGLKWILKWSLWGYEMRIWKGVWEIRIGDCGFWLIEMGVRRNIKICLRCW